jgi:hypothetical protein
MAKRKNHRKDKTSNSLPWLALAGVGLLVALGAVVIGMVTGGSRANRPTPQVTGAPRVQVSPESLDHGDIHFLTTIESRFEVRNVGDEPLEILGEPRVDAVEGC